MKLDGHLPFATTARPSRRVSRRRTRPRSRAVLVRWHCNTRMGAGTVQRLLLVPLARLRFSTLTAAGAALFAPLARLRFSTLMAAGAALVLQASTTLHRSRSASRPSRRRSSPFQASSCALPASTTQHRSRSACRPRKRLAAATRSLPASRCFASSLENPDPFHRSSSRCFCRQSPSLRMRRKRHTRTCSKTTDPRASISNDATRERG